MSFLSQCAYQLKTIHKNPTQSTVQSVRWLYKSTKKKKKKNWKGSMRGHACQWCPSRHILFSYILPRDISSPATGVFVIILPIHRLPSAEPWKLPVIILVLRPARQRSSTQAGFFHTVWPEENICVMWMKTEKNENSHKLPKWYQMKTKCNILCVKMTVPKMNSTFSKKKKIFRLMK